MKIQFTRLEIKSFDSDDACMKFIAEKKWTDGYTCRRCGNSNFCKGKIPYSRRCTRCKYDESAASHTVFHHCRVALPEAFKIMLKVCKEPGISTYKLSMQMDMRHMTCWRLKTKLLDYIGEKGEIDLLFNGEIKNRSCSRTLSINSPLF